MRSLTKIRDLDLKLLSTFDDKELFNTCKIKNHYIHSLCSDELFWKNRFYSKFPRLVELNEFDTWKKYYLNTVKWTSLLEEKYGFVSCDWRDSPEEYYELYNIYENEKDDSLSKDEKMELEMFYGQKFGTKEYHEVVLDEFLLNVVRSGYLDLAKFLIEEKGAENIHGAMNTAAATNDMETFLYFENLIPQDERDYRDALQEAEDYNSVNILKYLQTKM